MTQAAPAGEYLPLPVRFAYDDEGNELFSAAQMFNYVDADRAMRTQTAPEDIRSILVRCREFIDTTKIPAYPAGADLADEIDALLAAQAAPQQGEQKPYAYAVYFPDQPTVELVHDLDELTDDLTNREHQITKLYVAQQLGTTGLVGALEDAQRAINSMKVEAETAAQGDEQMMLEACETISNEGLQADMAIRAALASHRQAPAQAAPVQDYPPLPDFDTVEQHIYGTCRRYITRDMLEPIHNLIRETVDADRAARKQGANYD